MIKVTKEVLDNYTKISIDGMPTVGMAASADDFRELEEALDIIFPSDVLDLYLIYNGIGLISKSGKTYWHFHPLSEMISFINGIRNFFSDTHPELARRFLPIFDWNSGDAVGYLMGEDGKWKSGMYEFEHESYEFKTGQPESEFISRCNGNMVDFLRS